MGLVHAPSLLFLDEPSTGLDPQNRANLWEHILRMRRRSTPMTIVLTTHYLDEADSMAEPGGRRRPRRGDRRRHRRGAEGRPRRRPDRRSTVGRRATLAELADAGRAVARRAATSTVDGGELTASGSPTARGAARAARGRAPAPASPVASAPGAPADPRRRLPHPHRPQPARGRERQHPDTAARSTGPEGRSMSTACDADHSSRPAAGSRPQPRRANLVRDTAS